MKIDYNKHIWEGWTVQDFIDDLHTMFNHVKHDLKTRKHVKEWCIYNQPYYKKYIPEVVEHFYNIIKLQNNKL